MGGSGREVSMYPAKSLRPLRSGPNPLAETQQRPRESTRFSRSPESVSKRATTYLFEPFRGGKSTRNLYTLIFLLG